jgi:hypothetical protein
VAGTVSLVPPAGELLPPPVETPPLAVLPPTPGCSEGNDDGSAPKRSESGRLHATSSKSDRAPQQTLAFMFNRW